MAREQSDSFISRFLFRGSKERETQVADIDYDAAQSPESDSDHTLIWATNGEKSVQKLVERVLNGGNALVVTGYQDFLSAMSIILRIRPNIISEAPETIRIIFGTNTENKINLEGKPRELPEEARDYFLETRGLSLRSLD
jgi:hypothetical protein